MTEVIAVRIPKELKDELSDLNIDYAVEVKKHLERMVNRDKLRKIKLELDEFRKKLGKKIGKTSASSETIRGDRENAH